MRMGHTHHKLMAHKCNQLWNMTTLFDITVSKGLNTGNKVFVFLLFYKFANISKNLFLFSHYAVLCVD